MEKNCKKKASICLFRIAHRRLVWLLPKGAPMRHASHSGSADCSCCTSPLPDLALQSLQLNESIVISQGCDLKARRAGRVLPSKNNAKAPSARLIAATQQCPPNLFRLRISGLQRTNEASCQHLAGSKSLSDPRTRAPARQKKHRWTIHCGQDTVWIANVLSGLSIHFLQAPRRHGLLWAQMAYSHAENFNFDPPSKT